MHCYLETLYRKSTNVRLTPQLELSNHTWFALVSPIPFGSIWSLSKPFGTHIQPIFGKLKPHISNKPWIPILWIEAHVWRLSKVRNPDSLPGALSPTTMPLLRSCTARELTVSWTPPESNGVEFLRFVRPACCGNREVGRKNKHKKKMETRWKKWRHHDLSFT